MSSSPQDTLTLPHLRQLAQCVPHRGARCSVRRLIATDAPAFYDFARLPEVSRHMNWPPHQNIEETRSFLGTVLADYDRATDAPLAIADLSQDRCIGFVGFTHLSSEHRRADLAIALHPGYAGRGIAFEACQFLLQQARLMGLMRVQAVVEVDNQASIKLMQRLGMQERALLHHYLVSKQGPTDAYLFATFFEDNTLG